VAIGETKHAERYCEQIAPSVNCLTDDGRTIAHELYGLKEGSLGELLNLNVVKGGLRAAQRGFMGDLPTGNTKMMSGTFIVDQGGIIRYIYYSKDAADHPAMTGVIAAARSLTRA